MKKMIAVLLSMLMVCCFVSARGSQPGQTSSGTVVPGKTWNGIDVSQPQVIKMYLLGDIPNDLNTVWTEINKKIGEKINATVELSFLSWAEHAQKYSLLFSGGEDFDLIFTASSWAHYETTAAMGGFHALDDNFISKYAPGIKAVVPQAAWDQAKINGRIYMIPQYQNEFNGDIYAIRGDLMRKYGYSDLTTLPQVIEFFTKVAADQAATGISPRGNISSGMLYEYFQVDGYTVLGGSISELFLYHTQDASDVKPMYLLDWPKFEQYCNDMKRFYELGFWSKDSLASADQRQDGLLRGTSASMSWNLGSCLTYAVQANTTHPDWDVNLIDYNALPKTVASYINNGVAINAASRKKERAMMALDLLYTDKEIHDMAVYGIPGVHWEPVGDKEYTRLPRSSDFGSYCTWGWNNMTLTREEYVPNPMPVQIKAEELEATWNRNIKPAHPLDSISIDKSGITSEVAMVESIIAQYYTPLLSGMAGDVPQAIAALKQQLTLAGIDKIIRVFNEQAAAHVAASR
ncbi:MAG: ABC transporter substrate-binding protein [Spirochaetaceae bacterium]|jgi:putative aldouronate transport system substrate-binding protein|nr:ABC transporter substrate-binding protein [Spirochaetaceae bacterium]